MSLTLFVIVMVVSFVVVRIGAIALQMTGLDWSLAKFQSLSCFTGTGFTTRESELITSNPQRRRIASVLMVLGNAGLVVMIASFADSMRPGRTLWENVSRRFLPFEIPSALIPWINITFVMVTLYVLHRVFTHEKFSTPMNRFLRQRIIRKDVFKPVTFQELLVATGGYGVSRIKVQAGSPVAGKTLAESQLRSYDVTVLAIERQGYTTPNPPANMTMELGDDLVCFGKLESIHRRVAMQL
jgi:Trk-type K+ transport system membrane component